MNSNSCSNTGWRYGVLTALWLGCGGATSPHAELLGEVSLDGRPIEEAIVYLSKKVPDRKSIATYEAFVVDGEFEFSSHQAPPPGDYEVILKPVEEDSEEMFERIREKKRNGLIERDQFLAAVARRGTIRVSLSADDTNLITIDLTSK